MSGGPCAYVIIWVPWRRLGMGTGRGIRSGYMESAAWRGVLMMDLCDDALSASLFDGLEHCKRVCGLEWKRRYPEHSVRSR